jgi:hypothetical protein
VLEDRVVLLAFDGNRLVEGSTLVAQGGSSVLTGDGDGDGVADLVILDEAGAWFARAAPRPDLGGAR